ncbi:SGNH hydrolase-type esterase domain-containing protein [Colletotrichum cereale]|nr:SGNH hydrolase-type esterase domain-containing protein [Colletotrichum cereale]
MKVYHAALGAFAGLAFAQDSGTTQEPTVDYAVDQCTQSAFDACPADGSVAHRCLKIERASDGVLADQCVSKCAADSPCLSRCGQAAGTGTAWCDASGGCHCDRGWDSAKVAPAGPEDLSWVKKWAAVGDSYSAGIGSGNLYPGNNSEDCSRYDQSYPAYIQSHELMPQDPPAAFEFLSCSGATAPVILDNQVTGMGTGYDVITVSAGGNDVGLMNVLNACVFQWNPFVSCTKTLKESSDLIRDVLPGNLDRLYAGLKDKISPGRKIYVTGYASFFDNTTTACDDVSWSFWFNIDKERLTTERRTTMNGLTLATNEVIQAAVQRAGDAFEYVGYNQYFSVLQGRFCEAGVKEPDANRNGLLFFEKDTEDADLTLLGRRDLEDPEVGTRAAALQSRQITDRGGKNRTEVSFEKFITDSIAEARAQDASLVVSPPDSSAGDPALKTSAKLSLGNVIGDLVPDESKRVFHPRPAGHAIIANLVVWRMTQGTVAAQNSPGNATEAAGCAIPLPNAPAMPGAVPGVVPDCQAAARACLSCLGGASGAGVFDCNFRFHSDCNACGGGDGCPC